MEPNRRSDRLYSAAAWIFAVLTYMWVLQGVWNVDTGVGGSRFLIMMTAVGPAVSTPYVWLAIVTAYLADHRDGLTAPATGGRLPAILLSFAVLTVIAGVIVVAQT